MNRRNFLRTSILGTAIAMSPISFSAFGAPTRKTSRPGRLNLSFRPYELKLRHAFNLAKNKRTTTPGVQVQIEYDGLTGYGEASMPPYLGESVASVTEFLGKLDLSQFSDPFRIEDIHAYMDSVAPDNRAAKASVDIALHDLTGKIMGQPWYKIWGLNPDNTPNTSYTISYQSDPAE
ncbi:MAG: dipeptide epimerase, partial [Muribaculaceae bacterium]|nr:dipeptide epimerase [Muribaculaceae bacterium]